MTDLGGETIRNGRGRVSSTIPGQFSVRKLLAVTSCVAIYAATAAWVLDVGNVRDSWDMPVLFYPSVGFMGFGLTVVPILFFVACTVSVVLTIRSKPRAWTGFYFFACACLIVAVFPGQVEDGTRWVAAMGLSSTAFVVEALTRHLPDKQLVAAFAAVGATVCSYLFYLSAIACAAV